MTEDIPESYVYEPAYASFAAFVLDSDDAAHIAQIVNLSDGAGWFDYTDVTYLTNQGGAWEVSSLYGCSRGYLSSCAIALDSLGQPGIAYGVYFNDDCSGDGLWYAYRTGSGWLGQRVDVGVSSGDRVALAFDSSATPHLCYDLTNPSRLKYAVRSGSDWQIETVPSSYASFPSLALDSQASAHVSYHDFAGQDLIYAWREATGWSREVVDSAGAVGTYTSIRVDALGEPRITYLQSTSGNLRYAWKRGGVWSVTDVDTAGDVGWFSSLVLDVAGIPHVAYQGTPSYLRYARLSTASVPEETGIPEGIKFGDIVTAPNPSSGVLRVRFSLRSPLQSAEVFDTSGRRLRRLLIPAGTEIGSTEWDGQDEHGRHIASGMYFLRIAADGVTHVRTIHLIR